MLVQPRVLLGMGKTRQIQEILRYKDEWNFQLIEYGE